MGSAGIKPDSFGGTALKGFFASKLFSSSVDQVTGRGDPSRSGECLSRRRVFCASDAGRGLWHTLNSCSAEKLTQRRKGQGKTQRPAKTESYGQNQGAFGFSFAPW
jgi:hypothetical protein